VGAARLLALEAHLFCREACFAFVIGSLVLSDSLLAVVGGSLVLLDSPLVLAAGLYSLAPEEAL